LRVGGRGRRGGKPGDRPGVRQHRSVGVTETRPGSTRP
jgi:hypothetical protein